jgi:hypothetical protein
VCGRMDQDDMQRAEEDLPTEEHRPAAAARSSSTSVSENGLCEYTPVAHQWWTSARCSYGALLAIR